METIDKLIKDLEDKLKNESNPEVIIELVNMISDLEWTKLTEKWK